MKKVRGIDWNGPKHEPAPEKDLQEDEEEEEKENSDPKQAEDKEFTRENPAPFIYSASINNETNVIMAGGSGANQVRLFDYETGNVLCVISDLPKAILTLGKANTTNDFAFGSVDSKIRIMTQRVLKEPLMQ